MSSTLGKFCLKKKVPRFRWLSLRSRSLHDLPGFLIHERNDDLAPESVGDLLRIGPGHVVVRDFQAQPVGGDAYLLRGSLQRRVTLGNDLPDLLGSGGFHLRIEDRLGFLLCSIRDILVDVTRLTAEHPAQFFNSRPADDFSMPHLLYDCVAKCMVVNDDVRRIPFFLQFLHYVYLTADHKFPPHLSSHIFPNRFISSQIVLSSRIVPQFNHKFNHFIDFCAIISIGYL